MCTSVRLCLIESVVAIPQGQPEKLRRDRLSCGLGAVVFSLSRRGIALGCSLLQALDGGEAPSSVFGGEHLLRLFVRLPQLLPMAMLPPTAAEVLEAHLKQFIAWMASHQKELFLPSAGYRAAVPQHAGALPALHSGAAVGAPAGAEVVGAFAPPDRPGHASGANMNGNGSDMVA